jgi:hypothetical protein
MYYYVDTRETVKEPQEGVQWTAWFHKASMNNPGGYEFTDVINGVEVALRAWKEEDLEKFLRNAYHRAPFIKPVQIEYKGDE